MSCPGPCDAGLDWSTIDTVVTTPTLVLWKVVNLNGTRLVMQADGNLVLHQPNQRAVWSTNTYQGPDNTAILILQNDGNLVLYRDSDGSPIWDTGTWGH